MDGDYGREEESCFTGRSCGVRCGFIPCFREAGFCDYGPAEGKTAPGRRGYLSRRDVTLFWRCESK